MSARLFLIRSWICWFAKKKRELDVFAGPTGVQVSRDWAPMHSP